MTFKNIQKQFFMFLTGSRLAIPLVIAALIGIASGYIVVGFIKTLDFCHTLFFEQGKESISFLGKYAVILIPAVGGIFVGLIVTFFAPEAKGHGVPEVMKSIVLQGGRIRPIVVVAKAIASALAIGSGASVGREGPIVQVGSALGSNIGQLFRFSESRIKNFVACGAAAGISGVFNTPIAGVMFASEVILRDFGARALSTVVVAAVSASIVSRMYLGDAPAFIAPAYSLLSPFEMFIYLGLGVLSAFVALAFIRILHRSEKAFDNWSFPDWLKPAVGGLLIGIIGVYYPQIFGAGLSTIEQAIHGKLALDILFTLVILKMIATSLSLGSGSSGGVFAPALFMGAVLGGGVGNLFFDNMPFEVAPPGAYALVGMASVFAAAAHAPVTAILIVFEMTGDYKMILPLMVTTVVAVSISQLLSRESIYTIKLKDRGIDIDSMEEVKVLGAVQVKDAMSDACVNVPRTLSAKELIDRMSKEKEKTFFIVNSDQEVTGMIYRKDVQDLLLEKNMGPIIAEDIARPLPEYCFPDEPLSEAAQLMSEHHLRHIPVMDPAAKRKVIGILSSEDIFNAYTQMTLKRDELVSRIEQEGSFATGTRHMRFSISMRSGLGGKAIRDIDIPDGVVLTSIQRKKTTLIPEGHTVLKMHDKIWAVVHPQSEAKFLEWIKKKKLEKSLLDSE